MTVKQHAIELLTRLPKEATIEDKMDQLYLLYHIEAGLADVEAGRTFSQEEVEAKFSWLYK